MEEIIEDLKVLNGQYKKKESNLKAQLKGKGSKIESLTKLYEDIKIENFYHVKYDKEME